MRGYKFLAGYILFAACLSLLSGCHATLKDRFASEDLQALQAIYDASSGSFHSSQTDIRVLRGGSVNIQVHGNVAPKAGVEGDVWIPLLLARKPPPYFHVVPPGGTSPITLEAYQFKSGLWCITAVVPQSPQEISAAEAETSDQASNVNGTSTTVAVTNATFPRKAASHPLDFQVELSSPDLKEGLPFSIPSDPTGESTTISVELPRGASFSNDTSVIQADVVRGWQSDEVADSSPRVRSSQSTASQNLTSIEAPSSFGPRRAATLSVPETVAWDFSGVVFKQPGFFSQFRPWFLPSAIALVLLVCAASLRIYLLAPMASGIDDLTSALTEQKQDLGRRLQPFSSPLPAQATPDPWHQLAAALQQTLADVRSGLRRYGLGSVALNTLSGLEKQFSRFEEGAATLIKQKPPVPQEAEVASLSANVAALRKTTQLLIERYVRYRAATSALWLACLGALVALLILLATFARAQSTHRHPSDPQLSLPILCDLDVMLAPHDVIKPGEKIDVSLRFSALTGDPKKTKSDIRVGNGGLQAITIDPTTTPTNTQVTITQQSETQVTLTVPSIYSPLVRRINAISGFTKRTDVPAGYAAAVKAANHVNFTYTLQGAARPHLVSKWKGHSFYRFPFDSTDLDIPLDMEEAALLYHLRLVKPSTDFSGDVTVDGTNLALTEGENGEYYDFVNKDNLSRVPIPGHGSVVLHVKLERSTFQRWGLTLGVLLLAIISGFAGAWFTTLPDKAWQGYLFTTLGLGTLVFGVRVAVSTVYKDLPSLTAFQGMTLFDVVYFVCMIFMVATLLIARHRLKQRQAEWQPVKTK